MIIITFVVFFLLIFSQKILNLILREDIYKRGAHERKTSELIYSGLHTRHSSHTLLLSAAAVRMRVVQTTSVTKLSMCNRIDTTDEHGSRTSLRFGAVTRVSVLLIQ